MQISKKDWMFIAVIAAVIVIFVAISGEEKTKRVPLDEKHQASYDLFKKTGSKMEVDKGCPACHFEPGGVPFPPQTSGKAEGRTDALPVLPQAQTSGDMTTLNLTLELERLIHDITLRIPELCHIDPHRVLVCVSSGRPGAGGSYAKIHPLRFAGGQRSMTARRGRRRYLCTMPTILHQGEEMLYVIYFLIPRFLELSFREKLITVFHELYHISPECDGDIRRFPGRNYAHGSSTRKYNALMGDLVDSYLQLLPTPCPFQFLEGDLHALRSRHSALVARRLPAPRITLTPA